MPTKSDDFFEVTAKRGEGQRLFTEIAKIIGFGHQEPVILPTTFAKYYNLLPKKKTLEKFLVLQAMFNLAARSSGFAIRTNYPPTNINQNTG